MTNKPYSEKRKEKRIKQSFILSYYDLNDPLVRHNASQLKNISLGGMCLITSKVYPQGTQLGVEVKTHFSSENIHLQGIVLGSEEKIKNIIYETRIEFHNVSDKSIGILKKLIEHFENKKA